MGDVVHLDVVGVAVAAVPVVADEDVGVLLVEDRGEAAGGLVELGTVEGPVPGVVLPAGHAGVDVAEPGDAGGARDGSRGLGLLPTVVGEAPPFAQVVGDGPVLAAGRVDDDHPAAGAGGEGHRPGGPAGLVVGMGVEEDGGRHEDIVHRRTDNSIAEAGEGGSLHP